MPGKPVDGYDDVFEIALHNPILFLTKMLIVPVAGFSVDFDGPAVAVTSMIGLVFRQGGKAPRLFAVTSGKSENK